MLFNGRASLGWHVQKKNSREPGRSKEKRVRISSVFLSTIEVNLGGV
jgi:hypothetical protein